MATDPTATPDPEPPVETSLRDDLDAAFAQHATDEVEEQPPTGDRPRDEQGRFAKTQEPPAQQQPGKAPGSPQEALAQPPGTPGSLKPPQTPQQPELKAPASWTPTAREKWGTVDPELRAEITRRENEAQRVLQDAAGLREFARNFSDIVRPYEMFIRAENSDPLNAVQNLMSTAAQLRVGTPQAKVGIVTSIIRQHGIDLKMLDDALAQAFGVTQPGQAPQQPLHDPRVDQLLAMQQQQEWQRQQEARQRDAWETQALQQGLAQFAQTHEFYTDVAEIMADLVDAANRRGQQIDLEKIYTRACQLDEQVSTILAQRAAAQPPGGTPPGRGQPATSPAVLRARRAAASLKGDPSPQGATVPKDDSIRASIEAAFDAHSM